jgi:hypothetical protein
MLLPHLIKHANSNKTTAMHTADSAHKITKTAYLKAITSKAKMMLARC